ncbi:hypothetical protein N0V86_005266 [Didymella sp. IMI 355093]|nr:hypothetical protein N0V86_005266 [Didymella sp. IMI 355093]
MAVGTGITEVVDSEEEPLTSSPAAVSETVDNKLSATAGQDAQAVACPHQEVAEHSANEASACTHVLDIDQEKYSIDIESTHNDQSDSSTQKTAINDVSVCAPKETSLQTDAPPQASVHAAGAYQQGIRIATDGSIRGAETSPTASSLEVFSELSPNSKQDLARADEAFAVPQQDSAAAGNEASAAGPSCGLVHEATINAPYAAPTKISEATVAASQYAPDTVMDPDPAGLDALPKAPDLASSGGSQGQHNIATESSTPHDASPRAPSEGSQNTIDNQNVGSKTPEVQAGSQSTAPAAKLSPQEVTLAELRAQKVALLSLLRVQPAIQVLMENDVDMFDNDGEPTEAEIMAAANKIVKEHIKLLHEYNELKDVGQGLMGLIADQRGVRIVEVQDEFGIDAND